MMLATQQRLRNRTQHSGRFLTAGASAGKVRGIDSRLASCRFVTLVRLPAQLPAARRPFSTSSGHPDGLRPALRTRKHSANRFVRGLVPSTRALDHTLLAVVLCAGAGERLGATANPAAACRVVHR